MQEEQARPLEMFGILAAIVIIGVCLAWLLFSGVRRTAYNYICRMPGAEIALADYDAAVEPSPWPDQPAVPPAEQQPPVDATPVPPPAPLSESDTNWVAAAVTTHGALASSLGEYRSLVDQAIAIYNRSPDSRDQYWKDPNWIIQAERAHRNLAGAIDELMKYGVPGQLAYAQAEYEMLAVYFWLSEFDRLAMEDMAVNSMGYGMLNADENRFQLATWALQRAGVLIAVMPPYRPPAAPPATDGNSST